MRRAVATGATGPVACAAVSNQTPRFVDLHAHHTPPGYVALLEELAEPDDGETARSARLALDVLEGYGDRAFVDIELRRDGLEAAAIDHQVLSFIGVPVGGGPEVQVRLADTYNDGLAELCSSEPHRFSFAARVARSSGEDALATYRRARERGAVGVGLTQRHEGSWLTGEGLEPLLAELDRDHGIVLLHPTGTLGEPCGWASSSWPVGAVVEDVMGLLLLVDAGVLEAFPGVQWVVPHLGGVLPFLRQRLEEAAGLLGVDVGRVDGLANLWFDTANPQASAVALAAEVLGADRLVLGTDYPYAQRPLGPGATSGLLGDAGLSPEAIAAIGWDTPMALLEASAGWGLRLGA